MNRYTLEEFVKLVESADIIYGTCNLNAAMTVQSRIRKKSLLNQLNNVKGIDEFGVFAELTDGHKGRKILKLI